MLAVSVAAPVLKIILRLVGSVFQSLEGLAILNSSLPHQRYVLQRLRLGARLKNRGRLIQYGISFEELTLPRRSRSGPLDRTRSDQIGGTLRGTDEDTLKEDLGCQSAGPVEAT